MTDVKSINLVSQISKDVKKIKKVKGEISNLRYKILDDKIIIKGNLNQQISYVGKDNIVHHLSKKIPFNTFLNVPGAKPNMMAIIDTALEWIDCEILSSINSKIITKAIIKITAKVADTTYIQISPGTDETIAAEIFVTDISKQTMTKEKINLDNPCNKISEIVPKVIVEKIDLIEDKVIVQGMLHLQIFYVGEDNISYYQKADIPLSCCIDAPGVMPYMKAYVETLILENTADLLSTQKINTETIILWKVSVVNEVNTDVEFSESGPKFLANVLVGTPTTFQYLLESNNLLEPEAQKVQDIKHEIYKLNTAVIADKILIRGILCTQIYYVGNDDISCYKNYEVPFSTFIDYEGALPGHIAKITFNIEHNDFELKDSEFIQKTIIAFNVTVLENREVSIKEGNGSVIRIPQIVGEATKQLPICDKDMIKKDIIIKKIPIVMKSKQTDWKQIQVDKIIDVSCCPIAWLGTDYCYITNVVGVPGDDNIKVSGNIIGNIYSVGVDKQVHHIKFYDKFSVLVPMKTCPYSDLKIDAEIKHKTIELYEKGKQVKIIFTINVKVLFIEKKIEDVITDVKGPGITTEKILVNAMLPTNEMINLFVVTEVYNLIGYTAIKKSMLLDVVDVGPKLIEVVTDIKSINNGSK